jgi:hypothetical protein
MPDKPDGKRWRWLNVVAWLVPPLLAAYPLSIGPLSFLNGTGLLSNSAIAAIRPAYMPLLSIGKLAPPAERLLIQYDTASHEFGRRIRR